ncbi:protein PIGMENT DEFECTIVE 338, chloroplastic [Heracleum sosnowskyi]|uniref:Protein PIGMENT DEFECTIVE 338, chloroplastic n=1 Tax=Heracleum sosnowskyi TaxID=360622 RepID=A0AAD8M4B4_9APIA|nr:protein PIGMENT DEFECTIVE 338, chloroplastic [Heracleum sosnowskyi]
MRLHLYPCKARDRSNRQNLILNLLVTLCDMIEKICKEDRFAFKIELSAISVQDRTFSHLMSFMTQEDGVERWHKPTVNSIKINTDAAIFEEFNRFSFAVIVCDHAGILIEAMSKCKEGQVTPILAEAVGVKEALSWIITKVNGHGRNLIVSENFHVLRSTHVSFSSKDEIFTELSTTHLVKECGNGVVGEVEELELLDKPFVKNVGNGSVDEVEVPELRKLGEEEVLEPFLKFFKTRELGEEVCDSEESDFEEEVEKVSVEYYEPKAGDFVVGVVVSGNENKLDVNIGADLLGTMLKKEVLPLYYKEMEYLLCDTDKDVEEFMVQGKMGVVKNDEAMSGEAAPGRPVVEPGTILFAEVLGRTLSGRPLLSTRRLFSRLAWHRVRQIKQLNEPIEVRITEWNTGGLLTRIEGLRAFLPKTELINRTNKFTQLKDNVGQKIHVLVTRINEATNDLVISEKEAWTMLHLQEGTLLEGTVNKIFPYGAQIRIGETNRSGLLHISSISRARVASVSDLLAVDEKVKVLVVKSTFPDKISLSIAQLESEAGLFMSDKERVYSEAEEMAKKYRQKMPTASLARKPEQFPADTLSYEDEENLYSNWKWFKFEMDK